MTVQEFYEEVGGDYNDIMSRLRTEERIKKFAGMFTRMRATTRSSAVSTREMPTRRSARCIR